MIGKSCDKCPVKREAPVVCKKEQEWVEGHITECPVQWINEFYLVFKSVNLYEKGILPFSGGWAEQPAKLMRYIEIVNQERVNQNG